MLKKYDMELVYKKTFPEIVEELAGGRGKDLLARMQGLEVRTSHFFLFTSKL